MLIGAPPVWQRDTKDWKRDEEKRASSPCSFFYSQGRALVLAAEYFNDSRVKGGYSGVAAKHRHRIHLALYGQLMAAFEYMLKDFVATVIDATDLWDEALRLQNWIRVDTERLLAHRQAEATVGAMLLHPTQGWHDPREVNRRYKILFQHEPIESVEVSSLERLWLLRHSVAHNAGLVTSYDGARMGAPGLGGNVVHIDSEYMNQAFGLLTDIGRRLATGVGSRILQEWFKSVKELGQDYSRDRDTYERLKHLATFMESRPTSLPAFDEAAYKADFPT